MTLLLRVKNRQNAAIIVPLCSCHTDENKTVAFFYFLTRSKSVITYSSFNIYLSYFVHITRTHSCTHIIMGLIICRHLIAIQCIFQHGHSAHIKLLVPQCSHLRKKWEQCILKSSHYVLHKNALLKKSYIFVPRNPNCDHMAQD